MLETACPILVALTVGSELAGSVSRANKRWRSVAFAEPVPGDAASLTDICRRWARYATISESCGGSRDFCPSIITALS